MSQLLRIADSVCNNRLVPRTLAESNAADDGRAMRKLTTPDLFPIIAASGCNCVVVRRSALSICGLNDTTGKSENLAPPVRESDWSHREFFTDLLFHRRLRCQVAIDLKVGEFQPEFVGKMQFYLTGSRPPSACQGRKAIHRDHPLQGKEPHDRRICAP